jgi:ABC-type multidrug transport system fused ATPase/permease subunit
MSFAHGNRRALAGIAATATLGGFAEAGVLIMIARLAFAVASHDSSIKVGAGPIGPYTVAVSALIAVGFGLVAVRIVLQVVQARLIVGTNVRVQRNVRSQVVRRYLAASWALQSDERQGRLQEMVGGYSSAVAGAVMTLSTGVVAILSLATFLLTAFAVSAVAAIGVALAALLLALMLRPLRSAVRRASAANNAATLRLATDVNETTSHAQEVRVFGVEHQVGGRIAQKIDDVATSSRRAGMLGAIAPVLYQGTAMFLLVGAMAVVYAADFGRLGALGDVVLIIVRSLTYEQSLQTAYQSLHASAPALELVRDELDRYAASAMDRSGEEVGRIGALTFEQVEFEYEPGRPVLRDVSFDVRHGEIVGIVGPSGAGKSTLVQLVLRLRDPVHGRVLADGRDVRALALDDWYRHMSFVPQDPVLFAGTVAENIRFFREGADDADVERAAKLANLHDEVMAMPLGYDTSVGERGGHLSGGQRQRLCIARALVEEPDLLVFDEPTSSLDVKSESLIRETIAGLKTRTTVFVIAHRLSTLTICDRIMVLLDGRVEGFDTPARLESGNPFYREALQLSGMR